MILPQSAYGEHKTCEGVHHSGKDMIASLLLVILLLLTQVHRGLACDGNAECIMGFCITLDSGDRQCVCIDGYKGEHCDIRTSFNRLERAGKYSTCPCFNGGSCVYEEDEELGEAESECSNCSFTSCTLCSKIRGASTCTHAHIPGANMYFYLAELHFSILCIYL